MFIEYIQVINHTAVEVECTRFYYIGYIKLVLHFKYLTYNTKAM